MQQRRLTAGLIVAVVAMFGFGFALVPLYNVFCEVTGINGKTATEAAAYPAGGVDRDRTVRVEFVTYLGPGVNWEFAPEISHMEVHPGELHQVDFLARNLTRADAVGQAVPSVSPGQAASHFNKTECFCFRQQRLPAGEMARMPLRFFVDPALPGSVRTLTLSYTFYDVTESAPELVAQHP